jgi:hypothetical protein
MQDCHSACDSDGPCGGGGGAPPACILDQLMPFMVAEDELGMMQYLCSDQLDTSACDDAELADINDNVPGMCAELACQDEIAACHDSCQCSCDDQGCGDQACQDCHSTCDSNACAAMAHGKTNRPP